jgi:hypothetical protein
MNEVTLHKLPQYGHLYFSFKAYQMATLLTQGILSAFIQSQDSDISN